VLQPPATEQSGMSRRGEHLEGCVSSHSSVWIRPLNCSLRPHFLPGRACPARTRSSTRPRGPDCSWPVRRSGPRPRAAHSVDEALATAVASAKVSFHPAFDEDPHAIRAVFGDFVRARVALARPASAFTVPTCSASSAARSAAPGCISGTACPASPAAGTGSISPLLMAARRGPTSCSGPTSSARWSAAS
jgi:hypothetical protein